MAFEGFVSTLNSTTSALGSSTTYTGSAELVQHFASVSVLIASDVASLTDGVRFLWSSDSTFSNIYTRPTFSFRLTDDQGNPISGAQQFATPVLGKFLKVAFVKDATFQSTLEVTTILHYAPVSIHTEPVRTRINKEAPAIPVKTVPMTNVFTSRSGTITSGGVAQTVSAAAAGRKYFFFQNVSDTTMWLNITGGSASATQPSVRLEPSQCFCPLGMVPTDAISVFCATTGKAFTAFES